MSKDFSALLLAGLQQPSSQELSAAIQVLGERSELISLTQGQALMLEGEVGDAAYLIIEGEAEVRSERSQNPIGSAQAGSLLGELALEVGGLRTASVFAKTQLTAFKVAAVDYQQAVQACPELRRLVAQKLYGQLSEKHQILQQQHQQLLQVQQEKKSLTFLLVTLLLLLTSYALINSFLVNTFQLPSQSWIMFGFSRVTELLAVLILWKLARHSGLTRRDMGLSLAGWKRALLESLALTLPALLLLYLLAIYLADSWSQPLGWDSSRFDYSYVTYLLVAPLQEWIARGVFQSSLQKLLGEGKGWLAVLLASLVFATLHLHLNPLLALVSLISGLIWGGLFLRHRSLVGISVSHFLLGNWVGLLGFWAIWT